MSQVELLREAAKVMRREAEVLPALIDDAADDTDRVPVEMGEALRRHLRQLVAVVDWLADAADLDPSERETRCGWCGADHAVEVARAYLGGES